MRFLFCYLAACVSAADRPCGGEKKMMLFVGENTYNMSGEAAQHVSGLVAKYVLYCRGAGMDGEGIKLAAGTPAYLETGERREPGWWRGMLDRVLRSTCSRFWVRVQLAGYLTLGGKTMAQFSRHVIGAIGEAGRERTGAETAAMDGMYPHIVRELLVQNSELSMGCWKDRIFVNFRDYEGRRVHAISRDRHAVENVVFSFREPEEVEGVILETLWKWIQHVFPRAKDVVLRAVSWIGEESLGIQRSRRCLCRQEIETALGLGGADTVEICSGTGSSSIVGISPEKLSGVRGISLSGRSIDSGNIEMLSRCRLEALVLDLNWCEYELPLQGLLRKEGEIRRSLRSLRVKCAGYLTADDIWCLRKLKQIEEIEFEGRISNACLSMMSEGGDVEVAKVLRRVKMRLQMWWPGDESINLLCGMEVEDLELYDASVRKVKLLFSRAPGSRLARRLRRLRIGMREEGEVTETVDAMPFEGLEHLCLDIYSKEIPDAMWRALGDDIKARINVLTLWSSFLQENGEEISNTVVNLGLERLENLEELELRYFLRGGDLARIVAGKRKLRRLVVCMVDPEAEIIAEDAEAIVGTESLQEVTISNCNVSLEGLEILVRSRKFADRHTRLEMCVGVGTGSMEQAEAASRLEALGTMYTGTCFKLNTEKIDVVVDR